MTPNAWGSRPRGQNPLPLWVIDVINYNPQSADLNTQGEKIMQATLTTTTTVEYVQFNNTLHRIPSNVNKFEFLKELRESSR